MPNVINYIPLVSLVSGFPVEIQAEVPNIEMVFLLEGNYLFTGVVSVTLNFHPQGRNVNDVTNEGKS